MYYYILPNELEHHGIKGQKWGVRRFQNKDGTLTQAGREHIKELRNIKRNLGTTDYVNDIVRSLSFHDKNLLGADLDEPWISKSEERETLANKAKTFVEKDSDLPVSFVEIWTNGTRTGQVALATRRGDKDSDENPDIYRGKGYASRAMKKAVDWCDKYGKYSIDELEWWAHKSNIGSNKLAKKYGFIEDDNKGYSDWNRYTRKVGK